MHNLNKIFGVVLVLFLSFIATGSSVIGAESTEKSQKILVLSDRVEQANAKYFIYPQVSEMVASDIINNLNLDGNIKAPSLSDVRSELRTPELVRSSYALLDNYRYTYDVNYSALRKIAKHFDVTNVLLVTGSVDTTSNFLKPTWWAFLNVPGENVVKSEFKLYTYIALIDLNNETIKWQNVYERKFSEPEFGMTNLNYSPDAKQMVKVKKGSQLIAKDATYRVESVLTPLIAAQKTPPTVHELVKLKINKKYEESVLNIKEFKNKTSEKIKEYNEKRQEKNNLKEVQTEEKIIPAVEKVEEKAEDAKRIEEKDSVLNFVNEQPNLKIEEEQLNEKIKEVVNDKSIQIKPQEVSADTDLRPAINVDKNIKINPLNIIIPKM